MQPAIETANLRKEFGATTAVEDLTLTVQQGEVFGFLGPNGAGKTTSVKMLLGLTAPTAGGATLLGRPLGDLTARRRIGYLPEHFRFYPWLKAGEFLDLHGRLYGMSGDERRRKIGPLLQRVGLGERLNTPLSSFSKGMTQRIGLAQALINTPDLVILDEPTSGLDPLGRRLVRDVISELREQGTTVFINSHLLSEIEKTCDRVAFIRHGRVLEIAALDDYDQNLAVELRLDRVDAPLLEHVQRTTLGAERGAERLIEVRVAHADEIAALIGWLVANDYQVYQAIPKRQSLEERFIQVVGETSGDAS